LISIILSFIFLRSSGEGKLWNNKFWTPIFSRGRNCRLASKCRNRFGTLPWFRNTNQMDTFITLPPFSASEKERKKTKLRDDESWSSSKSGELFLHQEEVTTAGESLLQEMMTLFSHRLRQSLSVHMLDEF
jgi:hypothetical protein